MSSDQHAARLAGFMFLFLISTVLVSSILLSEVDGSTEILDILHNVSNNTPRVRLSILFQIVGSISTLILATTLYMVTRHQGKNLAILALLCRATEAALYTIGIISVLILLSLGERASAVGANDLASVRVLGEAVSYVESMSANIGAIFFAVGSTLYSYLFFKARSIPTPLAVLGLAASLILVVSVPIQTAAGHITDEGTSAAIWIPMLIFEISTGLWLLIKGAKIPGVERAEQVNA